MGAPIGNDNARKYKSAEELQILIEEYFIDCDDREVPYTMSGLAYALGISRQTLINMGKEELFLAQIKNAKDRVQRQMEENALLGKANATFSIFSLKNNYGWKDTVEQKVEHSVDNITPLINMLNASGEEEQENE